MDYMVKTDLAIIGRNTAVDFVGYVENIPAKVDTGADSSAVWASNISVDKKGMLHFYLFDRQSACFTGKEIRTDTYGAVIVRSASGHEQVRYKVPMSVRIEGRRIKANFTLADRSLQKYPALIGRRTLNKKFLVDVSKAHYRDSSRVFTMESNALNDQVATDPYGFYVKHFGKKRQDS